MPWTGRELLDVLGATLDGLPEPLHAVLDRRVDRLSGGQLQLLRGPFPAKRRQREPEHVVGFFERTSRLGRLIGPFAAHADRL